MKKVKKFLSIFLVLIILASAFTTDVFANGVVSLYNTQKNKAEKATVKTSLAEESVSKASLNGPKLVLNNDVIELHFEVSGKNIEGLTGNIEYDSSKLTLIETRQSLSAPWAIEFNGDYFVAYDNALTNPISSKAEIFVVKFRVNETLKPNTPISVTCKNICVSDGKQDVIISDAQYLTEIHEHKNIEVRNKKEATCIEAGYTGDKYCLDCGKLIEKGTEVLAKGHLNLEVRNKKIETETDNGYSGDVYCKDCQTLISKGYIIPALSEQFDAHILLTGPETFKKNDIIEVHFKISGREILGITGSLNYDNSKLTLLSTNQTINKNWSLDFNGNRFVAYDKGLSNPIFGEEELFTVKFQVNESIKENEEIIISATNTTVSDGKSDISYSDVQYKAKMHEHVNTELRGFKEATCTENGYTGDTWCLDCGTMIEKGTEIEAKGHKTVIDPAVSPTYINNGLTEGSHCSVCGEVFVKQEVIPALSINSKNFNITNNQISKIEENTTVNTLLANINGGSFISVYDGVYRMSNTDNVGTGMVAKILDRGTEIAKYNIVVTGDVNGDGKISISDMLSIKSHLLKKEMIEGVYADAGDVDNNKSVGMTDFVQIKAKLLGKGEITPR